MEPPASIPLFDMFNRTFPYFGITKRKLQFYIFGLLLYSLCMLWHTLNAQYSHWWILLSSILLTLASACDGILATDPTAPQWKRNISLGVLLSIPALVKLRHLEVFRVCICLFSFVPNKKPAILVCIFADLLNCLIGTYGHFLLFP